MVRLCAGCGWVTALIAEWKTCLGAHDSPLSGMVLGRVGTWKHGYVVGKSGRFCVK